MMRLLVDRVGRRDASDGSAFGFAVFLCRCGGAGAEVSVQGKWRIVEMPDYETDLPDTMGLA